jgi:oligopeptide transport system substrate-binding protein
LANKNFRLGFLYGLNVMRALQWYNHDEPQQWLMRGYTIRELCAYGGKDYADYVDDVFNEKQGTTGVTLTGISYGGDPIYNPTKAAQYFEAAHDELIAGGLTEADFPIQIDVIGSMNLQRQPYDLAMYSDLQIASNGDLLIGYNIPATDDQDSAWGSQTPNYDFSLWSGWGPDYADPQTFLHTMIIGGDMVDMMGFIVGQHTPTALETEILGEYTEAYDKAAAITDINQLGTRYQLFAEAEYKLIYEDAIIIPWLSVNGYAPIVSRTIPYTAGKASYGLTGDRYKNIIVTDSPITQDQRAAIKAAYQANAD